MKKLGVILLIIVVLSSLFLVFAQDETDVQEDPIEKAYSCLYDKVKDKCNSLTVEEQAFSLLALAHTDVANECRDSLLKKSRGEKGECWPSTGCKLKETSLATWALSVVGQDVQKSTDWLISKNTTPRDLVWYLEIDAKETTTCTISYSDQDNSVTISNEKQFNSDAGFCLKRAYNNYFLEVDQSCLKETFTVSCDQEFISTFLYTKKDSSVFHVSSKTQGASSGGSTENVIRAICFQQGIDCNYEGSLWTTLALIKTGRETSPFLPYLSAFADDNKKFFPESFLFILTDRNEFFSEINSIKSIDGFWDLNSQYSRFYDTALGTQAIRDVDDTREWLLSNQDNSGCWNNGNIRDTAFTLYTAWPQYFDPATGEIIEDVSLGGKPSCEEVGYYCISSGECEAALGKNLEDDHFCPAFSTICCDRPAPQEASCFDKQGLLCRLDERCIGNAIKSADPEICCIGECVPQTPPTSSGQKTECEDEKYECLSTCPSFKEEKDYSCNTGEVCCGSKGEAPPTDDEGGFSRLWLVFLFGILIVIVIIGIIFRHQIRLFLFKRKKGPERDSRFGSPRFGPRPFPPQRPRLIQRPGTTRPTPPRPRSSQPSQKSLSERELDETLKKLKEIEGKKKPIK